MKFFSWEWMFSWWNTFKDDGKKLLILTGKDLEGKLISIAPFYVERRNRLFRSRKWNIVRFCSSKETVPDHLGILCDKEFVQYFPQAVIAYLREYKAEWDEIKFEAEKR
jgi:hypothetical protein